MPDCPPADPPLLADVAAEWDEVRGGAAGWWLDVQAASVATAMTAATHIVERGSGARTIGVCDRRERFGGIPPNCNPSETEIIEWRRFIGEIGHRLAAALVCLP